MAQTFLVYSIRDAKTDSFSPPFFQVSKGAAMRVLSDLASNEQSTVSRHPEDFALFELATFDDTTGKFEPLPQPLHISNALEWKKNPAQA